MSDIIQRLKDAYSENPAKALELLPELFKAADNGKIVVLPYSPLTVEQLESVPKLNREALQKRLKRAEEREAAEKALEEQKK